MPRRHGDYQSHSYGFVQPQPLPDPMQTLSGMMSMASQAEAYSERQDEKKKRKAVDTAMLANPGDMGAAAAAVEAGGDWRGARDLRNTADEDRRRKDAERERTVTDAIGRLDSMGNIFGKSAQMLREVEGRPDLYGALRPQLVEMVSGIDPQLAAQIPEAYEPETVRGMIQFSHGAAVQQAERVKALTQLQASAKVSQDRQALDKEHGEVLARWFPTVTSAEEWDQTKDYATSYLGIPKETVDRVGGWDEGKGPERVRKAALTPAQFGTERNAEAAAKKGQEINTLEEALVKADEAGDLKGVERIMRLKTRLAAAGSSGSAAKVVSADTVATIMEHPEIYNSLTAEQRGALIDPLRRAGFDFGKVAAGLNTNQRRVIEAWKTDQITALNRERRGTGMKQADYDAEVARIEANYRLQIGEGDQPRGGNPTAEAQRQRALPPNLRRPAGPATPAAPSRQSGAAKDPNEQMQVTLPDGTTTSGTRRQIEAFMKDAGLRLDE